MPEIQQESLEMDHLAGQSSNHRPSQSAGSFTSNLRPSYLSDSASLNDPRASDSRLWSSDGEANTIASIAHLGNANSVDQHGTQFESGGCGDSTTVEPLLPGTFGNGSSSEIKECRKKSDSTAIGQAVLDVCISATSLYFLAFAIAALAHEGESVASPFASALLQAAGFGPTILPIMFAAIVGRLLTSFIAWRLERKIKLDTVESIMGSRTVFGVVSTPFRLRTLHVCTPFLLVLWALSPLGGQASLRAVFPGPSRTNTTVEVFYLNTSSPFSVQGASGANSFEAAINAAFVGALVGPPASKRMAQDAFGNLKVPFLETITVQSGSDREGWHVMPHADVEYSSLVGLPIKGIGDDGLMFVQLESSYLFPVCLLSLETVPLESTAWPNLRSEHCNNGWGQGMVLQLKNVSDVDPESPTDSRTVLFGSLGDTDDGDQVATIATCNLTTTHVETRYTCEHQACTPTAIRESRAPRNFPAASQQLNTLTGPGTWSDVFCSMFINATGHGHSATSSPLEQYIVDPDVPFRYGGTGERLRLAEVGEALFALRFAQLLNSYWMIGIAPYATTGALIEFPKNSTNLTESTPIGDYSTLSTEAKLQTTQTVLNCSRPWLILLIVSSLTMAAAGVATTIVSLFRRGPEVLDSFTSMLRDSPFALRETGPSTEDGSDKARRLAGLEVRLGDVRPKEGLGYIAVAAATEERYVGRLRAGRKYL